MCDLEILRCNDLKGQNAVKGGGGMTHIVYSSISTPTIRSSRVPVCMCVYLFVFMSCVSICMHIHVSVCLSICVSFSVPMYV